MVSVEGSGLKLLKEAVGVDEVLLVFGFTWLIDGVVCTLVGIRRGSMVSQ